MVFQKSKILKKLESHGWTVSNVFKPKMNTDIFEVICIERWNQKMFLWFVIDPISGYLFKQLKRNKFELKSSDITAQLSFNNPNGDKRITEQLVSELNLGNNWQLGVSQFLEMAIK